jgi:hypothetical protein
MADYREVCPVCGNRWNLDQFGTLVWHRDYSTKSKCPGSFRPGVPEENYNG